MTFAAMVEQYYLWGPSSPCEERVTFFAIFFHTPDLWCMVSRRERIYKAGAKFSFFVTGDEN